MVAAPKLSPPGGAEFPQGRAAAAAVAEAVSAAPGWRMASWCSAQRSPPQAADQLAIAAAAPSLDRGVNSRSWTTR